MTRFWIACAAGLATVLCIAGLVRGADFDSLCKDIERTARSGNVSDRSDRSKAVRKLGSFKSLASTKILVQCLGDPLPQIRKEALKALANLSRSPDRGPSLQHICHAGLFDRRNELRREHAAEALGRIGDPSAASSLLKCFKSDRSVKVRARAAEALGLVKAHEAVKALARALTKADDAAAEAALALGRLGATERIEALQKTASTNRHWRARAYALDALVLLKAPCLGTVCAERLDRDRAFQPRIAVCDALCAVADLTEEGNGREAALALLKKALEDKAWQVRVAAVEATLSLWDRACIDILVNLLPRVQGGRVMVDTAKALSFYVGRDLGCFPESYAGWWASNKANYKLPDGPKRNRWGGYVLDRKAGTHKGGGKKATVSSFFSMPIFSRSFAFLFDLSGSMKNGSLGRNQGVPKIEIARDQFDICVKKLAPQGRFNVYVYREENKWPVKTYMESFQKDLVPATSFVKAQARQWVRGAAVKGRGPFYDGLVKVTDNEKIDTVYLLADGSPSSGTYVCKVDFIEGWVRENRFRRVMVCTVLVGSSGINVDLMKWLAEVTGGFYVHYKGS